jgi:hypothetical protein
LINLFNQIACVKVLKNSFHSFVVFFIEEESIIKVEPDVTNCPSKSNEEKNIFVFS